MVDPEVQGSILRKIALHWVLLFLANTLALVVWMRLFVTPDGTWGDLLTQCAQRYLPFFVVSLALIPAFVLDTMKMTNRFAGPILRLRNALADVAAGRAIKPLRFRDNDFWQSIATDFNLAHCKDAVADDNGEDTDAETNAAPSADQSSDSPNSSAASQTNA
ncbi:MAG: hypothetical protein AAFP90_10765 [Planctomycetota bacterium]